MNPLDQNDLLSRYFAGEATAEERAQVEAWRRASSENRKVFAEFEKIWQNASSEKLPHAPDVDQSWMELAAKLGLPREQSPARILEMKKPPKETPRRFSWSDRYVWAAAAVLLLALGMFLYRGLQDASGLKKVVAAYGEQENIRLPDGSTVRLNSGSEIQFSKSSFDSARSVIIFGEAYFEVTRDNRPFIVSTENAQIKVLGTKFGIWSRHDETRVTVREGRVSLHALKAPPETAVELAPNQMSMCRQQQPPESPRTVDAGQLLAWLEGKIVFDQTPLVEVIAELQRVYNVSIELSNPALGQSTITGSFQNKSIESVLASICLTLNLQYKKDAGKYVISD